MKPTWTFVPFVVSFVGSCASPAPPITPILPEPPLLGETAECMANVIANSVPVTALIVISARALGPGEGLNILKRKRDYLSGPTAFRIVEVRYQEDESIYDRKKNQMGPTRVYQMPVIAEVQPGGGWKYRYSVYDGDVDPDTGLHSGVIMSNNLQTRLSIECGFERQAFVEI